MPKKKSLANFPLCCVFAAGILLSAPNITLSAQPGLDLVYNGLGVATYTRNAGNPITAIEHWIKVVDYDGIADDGSSHTVTVTYPNGGPTYNLWFYEKRDANSAIYEFWDDTIPQPIDPVIYSGIYTYRVEDSTGDWSVAEDDLQVNTLSPPDERTFSPGFSTPRSIIAHFDDVYKNGALYDDFESGFNPANWESQPTEVTYVGGKARFERTWFPQSQSIWMRVTDPETVNELSATVRVESISSNTEWIYARIGGAYCRDENGEVFARVGIKGNDTYITVYSEYWDGDHLIDKPLLPETSLGPVTQGNSYELTLDWDESTATVTFRVRGLNDSINYTDTYTVPGPVSPADNPYRAIGITSWVFLDTTPTFDWQAVPGANHYRVRIYGWNDDDDQIYQGYTKSPPYTLPPGIIKPDGGYKLRIYALRDHQLFEWENVSRSVWPGSAFWTASNEAQDPYIDLWNIGVFTWKHLPPFGDYTHFSLRIHDAQGVPDNIESVKVTLPDGITTVNLYIHEFITPTEGKYRGIYFGGTPAGPYSFTIRDKDGNEDTKTETLTPDPVDYLDEASLTPAHNTLIGGTGVNFDWDDVTDASNYWIAIYDKDLNYLFGTHTIESELTLPPGILNENSLYRYRIENYREFREDNLDNGSTSPPKGVWNTNTFTTTAEAGAAPPGLNLDRFGVVVWHAPGPATGTSLYWLDFMAMVTDADGVPENIERVEVIYPDGITIKVLKYDDSPAWGTNYDESEVYTDPALIQTGVYTFRVVDFGGTSIEAQDTLTNVTANIFPWPTNVAPADKTVVYTATPTISWNPVAVASYYKVRIMSAFRGPTVHWSDELTDTHYTIPDSILSNGATHGYRVYAYREASGNEVDFYSSNRSWHESNYRFTIQVSDTGPVIDAYSADVTSGLGPLTVEFSCAAHDPDGSIVEYLWDYDGDGTIDETTASGLVTHIYVAPGTYPALVTVEDSEGALATSNPITIAIIGDTDSDGMPDDWEILHGFNPLDSNDADLDSDNDGLSNLNEYLNMTHPHNPDTDGDTVIDGADAFPLDPNESADSDGDGIGDIADLDDDNDNHNSIADGGDDCDDFNPTIHPDATEIPNNGIDEDCDGVDPDTLPPFTEMIEPPAGASNVAVDTNIIAHVKDTSSGVDQSTIVMRVQGSPVGVAPVGSPTDYTLTYNLPTDFGNEQQVEVRIEAADMSGNAMEPQVYTFLTEPAAGDPWEPPPEDRDDDEDGIPNSVETNLLGTNPNVKTLFVRPKQIEGTAFVYWPGFIALFPDTRAGFADIEAFTHAGIEVSVIGDASHPYAPMRAFDYDPATDANQPPCDILEIIHMPHNVYCAFGHHNFGHTYFYTLGTTWFWDTKGYVPNDQTSAHFQKHGYFTPYIYPFPLDNYLAEGAYPAIQVNQWPEETSDCGLNQCYDSSYSSPLNFDDSESTAPFIGYPDGTVEFNEIVFDKNKQITYVGGRGIRYDHDTVMRRTLTHEMGHALLAASEKDHCTDVNCIMYHSVADWEMRDFGPGDCVHKPGGSKDIRAKGVVHNGVH